jgi:hypothetical protein
MAVPVVPTNFLVQQGNGQVFLSWNLVSGATSYSVERSVDGVNFSVVAAPSTNLFLDTTVLIGVNYFYQVAGVNGSGTGPYTTAQSVVATLSGGMTLGQIRLYAQQRADRVNSNFVTTTEWNTYINQSYYELYDLLINSDQDLYLYQPVLLVTDGVTFQYQLPTGQNTFLNNALQTITPPPFYRLWGVDCGLDASSNAWVTLKKFSAIQRNRYVYPQITSTFLGVFNLQYRLIASDPALLYFIPTPSANQYIRLFYIPRLTTLLQDTDIMDGISGWTEYVIVDAAIKALQKEESDVSVLAAQKEMLKMRIEESSINRDVGQPDTISDTRNWAQGNGWSLGQDGSYGGY